MTAPRTKQVHLALVELSDGSLDWQATTGEPPNELTTTRIIGRKTVTLVEGEGIDEPRDREAAA